MPLGDLFKHPHVLATFALSWVGWIVALAGVAATTSLGFNGASVGLLWWTVFLVLITNTVFTLSVVNGTFVAQRGVITSFITLVTALLTVSTSVTHSLVQEFNVSQPQAMLAGFIILDLVYYVWMIVLSNWDPAQSQGGVAMPKISLPFTHGGQAAAAQPAGGASTDSTPQAPPNEGQRASQAVLDEVAGDPVPATALFAYQANPNDPNELSFQKGDVLTILDKKGKWWRARTSDGAVGIVPSNYMEIKQ